jgi:type I restriction enzyme S subunit
VSNVDKKTTDGQIAVRLCNYVDVYYNRLIADGMPFMEATANKEQVDRFTLRQGDVLITKDSETPEDIAVPAFVPDDLPGVVCGYHLAVVRPRPRLVDGAYLYWALSSTPSRDWFSAAATGVTRFGLRRDAIGNLTVPLPPLSAQRALARFIDRETTRIDALISKKRRMIELLDERWKVELSSALRATGVRLKRLLRSPLAYGVLVPQHAGEDGVPMLRIIDLGGGRIDLDTVARIPVAQSAEYRRTAVACGDLVVSVVGTLGRSVEITSDLAGCNLNRALARVQLRDGVPRGLVRLWFESSQFQESARLATSNDSAQPTLGLGDLKNFVVGIPDQPSEWGRMAAHLERRRSLILTARNLLERQLSLLVEHRQALITAAVTGQLEVSEAAA